MKQKIAVTGGSGKLGRAVIEELLAHGHDPYVIDRAPPADPRRCRSFVADLTDYGEVFDALAGHHNHRPDAVVHLAANPLPFGVPAPRTFHNNATGDFHVFEAARRLGIRRIVWASSVMVFGMPFQPAAPPASLPIDEAAAPRPEVTYALVKLHGETMAEQFCRQDPSMTVVGLRLATVMDAADYARHGPDGPNVRGAAPYLWAYVDPRDAAQAVRRSVEAPLTGAHIFAIAAADTCVTRDSDALLAEFYPSVPRARAVTGRETLLSIDKARQVLGYAPAFSWRDASR